ncbi:MAG: response regulator [Deltaproteobacteria bacterium]|nr:response regulator [Deltaproteobacteria bacterium]
MEKDFYTIPEAAKICSVGRTTMWRWVKSGKVKAATTPGGRHRIPKSDLQFLLTRLGAHPLPESGETAHANRSWKTSVRILVVDDDPFIREMLSRALQNHGFQTEVAADGFEAGVKLVQFNPDLVFLDLIMPGMDGFEVCRRINENPSISQIKVIAITGFDTEENRDQIMKAGADGYLAKPLETSKLLQEVEVILSEPVNLLAAGGE